MSAHPNTLGLLDRAKRLIEESNPPDHSPLTTASRDIREARAAVAELIEADKEYDEAQRLASIGYGTDDEDRAARQRLREAKRNRRAAIARVGGAK